MIEIPRAATITSQRLVLTPLRKADAEEMAAVLGDERLHEFIGDHPMTLNELRDRYAFLIAGSPDPDEIWLNWIVRRREDVRAVGTVQASLCRSPDYWRAEIAWVIGIPFQNQGFASEAARALVAWLTQHDIHNISANIHPDHRASELVATRAGLHLTDDEIDGERVWRTHPSVSGP